MSPAETTAATLTPFETQTTTATSTLLPTQKATTTTAAMSILLPIWMARMSLTLTNLRTLMTLAAASATSTALSRVALQCEQRWRRRVRGHTYKIGD
jgi:hypothetical protein